ncbi:fimbria/pilus outer membrane usher protein [Variovorax paradoxus]|uniref:fimbria/pilus outer membrane usher protein n=1 Tax=Variovorax paradoxus TaxID=34073 RepID=UPI00277EF173|nr:fimbria/pilus outer membrane usher protein [Variovorax paradoxus]MDQ0586627.1 outer membrane usher protein [Variovorax paradoxus]
MFLIVLCHSTLRPVVDVLAPATRSNCAQVHHAQALSWLGALSLVWASPALGMPLAVSLLQPDGATVQLRVRTGIDVAPVVRWSETPVPGPYRLVLIWNDAAMTLERALPRLPPDSAGPLRALALHSTPDQTRLELQLSQAVRPHLRRIGDSWVLRLEPVARASPAIPAGASAIAPVELFTPVGGPSAMAPIASIDPSPPRSLALPAVAPTLDEAPPRPEPRPRRPGAANIHTKPSPELLLVDVSINGQRLKDVVRAEQLPSGPLLLPAEAWAEARLAPLAQAATLSDGTPGYALDALPGATYRIDRQSLSLEINAPAAAFVGSALGAQGNAAVLPLRPRPGVMLNYDVSYSRNGGSASSGAALEAVAFGSLGNFVTSALVSNAGSGSGYKATRLDSYWRYDLPQRLETLVVGDTVSAGGGWSRPARYGGIRFGRDFGLLPSFVTLPQFALEGQAALPSTVELLVNNARRLSLPVQPGPFDLTQVPIVTGAGEIGLVVRDLLGRETMVRQSYYASPRLLAPGLTDFSFEAGWLRTGYGRDSAYGDSFGAAAWRQGLTNSLTGETRLELQRRRRAFGVELSGLLGAWGVARGGLAASSGDTQGPRESGYLLQAGIERSTPRGGGALQYERASRGFAPFGEAIGPAAASQRARSRWLASVGGPLWGRITGGASYVHQTRWDGDQVKLLGMSLSVPIWQRASLSLSVNKRLDSVRSWRVGLSFNLPLDDGVSISTQVDRRTDGRLTGAVSAMRNPPSGPGLGWRVQAATTESQRAQAGLQYNTSQAEFALDVVSDAQGQMATRAGARGTVGWLGGVAFASRPVGQGSVAVVKVDGIEGVPVKRSNQVVALTDARGLAFVPGLLPWQKNQIEIDPADLPLDVEMANVSQEVTPFARSGVVMDFAVRRTRQVLLVLQQRNGAPVPVGAKVRLLPAGPEFITGRRGEVWLTDLAESRQRLQASWPNGGCTLELAVPASPDGTPEKIGPLACDEGQP